MKIKDLLNQIEYKKFIGHDEDSIDGVTQNSGLADKRTAFIAIKGLRSDGHRYVKDALAHGASCVILEKETDDPVNQIIVRDTNQALVETALLLNDFPTEKLELIGVTGTNGKTSITYMLEYLLREQNCAVLGTTGVHFKNYHHELPNTTPTADQLQREFRELVERQAHIVAMEVSSHALSLDRIAGCHFDCAIFSNLTLEHMDFHHTFENYYQAKKSLFLKAKKLVIINADDPYGERLIQEIKSENPAVQVLSYGKKGLFKIDSIKIESGFSYMNYQFNEIKSSVKIPVETVFNVYNMSAAMAYCLSCGMDKDYLEKRIEKFPGVPGRYETIPNDLGIDIILDFAHTPDALAHLLEGSKTDGREIWIVFGVAGDRTVEIRQEIGRVVGRYADHAIVTMDDPKENTVDEISEDIIRGLKESSIDYQYIPSRPDAIKKALECCAPGDKIFFTGKAMEKYMKIGTQKIPYDEKKIIQDTLREIKNKN